jgi:hypothetical protein
MNNDDRSSVPPPPMATIGHVHPEVLEAGVVASILADAAAHTPDAHGRLSPHTKRAYRVAYVFAAMRAKELELEQAKAEHTQGLIDKLERLLVEGGHARRVGGRRSGDHT